MRRNNGIVIGIALALVVALAGCGSAAAPSASTGVTPAAASGSNAAVARGAADYTSARLPASYENALPASTQLALGILQLEGTPQAVTPAQAKMLLPLWQAFQGGALQNQTEQNAVLKQIEGTLTAEQTKAIAAMLLTNDDMRKWMEEHGTQGGPPPGTPGAPGQGGGPPNMTDAQRAAFQATRQAGGGPPDFGNMTAEQRAAFRATAQASGQGFPPDGQGPAPRGTPRPGGQGRLFASYRIFVGPLVELLTARAAP